MMRSRRWPVVACLSAAVCSPSCGGASPSPPVAQPPETNSTAKKPAAKKDLPDRAPSKKRLLVPAGGVELRQASLLASELPGFVPENDLSGLRLSLGRDSQGPSETVALLDSQTPRPLDERGRVLESLLNENLELGPGYHRVVVVQARPDEVIHQSHVFSYVAKGSGDPELPPCVLYRPAGTYNGPVASNSIELLALPLGQGVTRFRYRMRGSGFDDELEAEVGRVVAAKEASSGDYRVEVDCVGQDGGTLATLKRIITVNREVILPQESD